MNTVKFSKLLGQVEVISEDSTYTTVIVLKTGETKKLLNQYANLSNEPFVTVKTKKTISVNELSNEDKENLAYLKATGRDTKSLLNQSTARYKTGKSGAASL